MESPTATSNRSGLALGVGPVVGVGAAAPSVDAGVGDGATLDGAAAHAPRTSATASVAEARILRITESPAQRPVSTAPEALPAGAARGRSARSCGEAGVEAAGRSTGS